MERQRLNVFRMRLLGAEVVGVDSGSRTLKDAINEAMRDWVTNVRTTHYLLGSVLGAHPYPQMVRDFHEIIGEEARAQILEAGRRLPDYAVRVRGRRIQRHRTVSRVPWRCGRENAWRRSGRARAQARRACRAAGGGRRDIPARGPACCKAPTLTCCKPRTGRFRPRIPFPRPRLPGRRP